jgi:hypothetical protein
MLLKVSQLAKLIDDPAQLIKVFQSIQAPYRSLLIYICRFLLKIISFESQNKMSKANISIIFGPNIFKAPESLGNSDELSITVVEDNFRYIRWLELLLNNFHEIFESEVSFLLLLYRLVSHQAFMMIKKFLCMNF